MKTTTRKLLLYILAISIILGSGIFIGRNSVVPKEELGNLDFEGTYAVSDSDGWSGIMQMRDQENRIKVLEKKIECIEFGGKYREPKFVEEACLKYGQEYTWDGDTWVRETTTRSELE